MTCLAAVNAVLPAHRYPQDKLTEAFAQGVLGEGTSHEVVRRIHANTRVGSRYLALPLEQYWQLDGFTAANNAYIEAAVELGVSAVTGALEAAGIAADEVDVIFATTVTGLAVPSLEARIAARVGFRRDVKRVPLFGLGCVAGAAGISRLHDYLRGWPEHVGVLLSVELCSLTVQRGDTSMANLVASGLFGDGAAAVVAVGSQRADRLDVRGPRVLATRSHLYPDTEGVMGWNIGTDGFGIVLTAEVPDLVHRYLGPDIRELLAVHGLTVDDVGAWVSHPGGPKIIEAIETELGVGPHALEMTWRSLAEVGNLSSASVLHVLRDTLRDRPPLAGTPGVLMAMGPGFSSELVLLRW
ncbi:MAG TPA: 3-oxoacyl-[acyl-carrier-protein] synthase III C-terminal domain-containing protein [Nakamurella sp.]